MALPVTIPNEFANATASIPLSQLDANFNTLANAVNGISDGSESLANVSVTGGTISNVAVSATTLNTSGQVVFNDAGADVDFRVEGDTNANLLFVDASADAVGIGTSSPSSQLHINPPSDNVFTNGLRVNRATTSGQYVTVNYTNGVANFTAVDTVLTGPAITFNRSTNGTTTTESMRIDSSGNLMVGITSSSFKLAAIAASGADRNVFQAGVSGASNGLTVTYVSGAMVYTLTGLGTGTVSSSSGVLSASSDQNMKIADGEITSALDKVLSLTPRYFYWKDADGNAKEDVGRQLGFFAQEVNAVLPEASPEPKNDDDGWGIYDRSLVAVLTKAIQELKAELDTIKAELATLKG